MLTLSKSQRIADAAVRRAQHLGINISVAVCDSNGRLIVLNQMNGSVGWEADRSSMGKAVAAAITGRASDRMFEQFGEGGSRLRAGNYVLPPRGQRGGLPVVEAGIVQGGCGVSGASTAEQDEECARAGIAALNIRATEPALVTDMSGANASRNACDREANPNCAKLMHSNASPPGTEQRVSRT